MSCCAASTRQRDATISGRRADEVERNRRRQRGWRRVAALTATIAVAALGARADERGESDCARSRSRRRIARARCCTVASAASACLTSTLVSRPALKRCVGDADDVLALRDRGQRNVALREQALQVEIGACDAGGERDARGLARRRPRACACDKRGSQRRAVLVPEVELVD